MNQRLAAETRPKYPKPKSNLSDSSNSTAFQSSANATSGAYGGQSDTPEMSESDLMEIQRKLYMYC
jgi:hypothetical protein